MGAATPPPMWLLHCFSVLHYKSSFSMQEKGLTLQLLPIYVRNVKHAKMCGLHAVFLLKGSPFLWIVYSGRALRSQMGRWVCAPVSMCEIHRWDHQMTTVGAWMSPRGELSWRKNNIFCNKTWQVCYLPPLYAVVDAWSRGPKIHCPFLNKWYKMFSQRSIVFLFFFHINITFLWFTLLQ